MKQWKRFLAGSVTAAMLAAMPVAASAANDITVYVDGQKLAFDQPPVVQEGRTLVPMRAIFEALGAEMEWDGAEKKVTAFWGTNSLELWIGNREIQMGDGSTLSLDVPAQVMNGRTLVPLRAVSQCMGAEVNWNGATKTVQINRPAGMTNYQNDMYLYTFDTPKDFYFGGEYEGGTGAWYAHKTDPVYVSVVAEKLSGAKSENIYALHDAYLKAYGDHIVYTAIVDDYTMDMLWDDGNRAEFSKIHLHHGVETKVVVQVPHELYETYDPQLLDICRCLKFG